VKENYESPFVKSLERLSLKKDSHSRAVLAKLRRGLGKKEGAPEMYRYVVPFLDPEKKRDFDDERHFLIASLFAMHPEPTRGVSMGKVFRAMASLGGNTIIKSVEKRFEYLLSVDGDDLGGHLRQAVSLAKSKGVAIDYHQLFSDVKDWNRTGKPVQLRWARDFWGYEKEQTNNETESKGEVQ
jgi:CRISPR system Cascade subunit CasB